MTTSQNDTVEPSLSDTIGNQHFVHYNEVSLTQAFPCSIYPVGVLLCNQAIEHNVAVFSELSFAVRWQGRLSRG